MSVIGIIAIISGVIVRVTGLVGLCLLSQTS